MNRPTGPRHSVKYLVPLALLLAPAAARADHPPLHVDTGVGDCSIRFASNLTQSAFGRFVREFGSVSAYKFASAPGTLGRHRVAVGIERLNFTVEEHADAWNDTFVHPDSEHELGSELMVPKLRVRFGLTDHLDVGGYYSRNVSANYGWVGADVHYAPLRQNATMPITLAVRGAYTRTLYADDLDLHTLTNDIEVGRTYGGTFTPYFGVGSDLMLGRERSDAVQLEREEQSVSHWMAGAEYRLRYVALGAEVGRGALTTFQLHVTGIF